eukprot:8371305-Ditylum_brightwellii.AAC.1
MAKEISMRMAKCLEVNKVTDNEQSKKNFDTNAQYSNHWDHTKMTAIVCVIDGEEWRVRDWEKTFACQK